MSKRKSTKHCCFVLFCGAPRALLSGRCAAGGHHRPSGHRPAAHPGGEYHDGKVLDPISGKVYKGKARLSANGKRLTLRGYVGVSVIGRSVTWVKY